MPMPIPRLNFQRGMKSRLMTGKISCPSPIAEWVEAYARADGAIVFHARPHHKGYALGHREKSISECGQAPVVGVGPVGK